MNFKTNISKEISLILISLLFFSFKASYTENSEIISSSIDKIFKSGHCSIDFIDDTFSSIVKDSSIIGYLACANAPSKFLTFDYYILFDSKGEILKVEILDYRENWGVEICNKRWLKKFEGIDIENYHSYNKKIDAISGATISVNSLKYNVLKISQALKLKL